MPATPLSVYGLLGFGLPAADLLWENLVAPRYGLLSFGPIDARKQLGSNLLNYQSSVGDFPACDRRGSGDRFVPVTDSLLNIIQQPGAIAK